MTGFIIKPRHDRIEIATDGAVYDADGVLLDTMYKVRVAANLPLAVVGSGTVTHIDMVADAILAAAVATGSVDATIGVLAQSLREIADDAAFDSPVRIAIAAISETRGPTSWVFDTYDADGPAFELREALFGIGQGELPPAEDLLARGIEAGDSLEKHAAWFFEYSACRARFIIYANSTEAPTSGDNDVLRQFNDGSQDVFQILRPGAADPPNFSDIVIDSRWPCIQILAEGYIPVGTGELTHTINFDGTGCFPMVKYMTVHGAGSGGNPVASWTKRVRPPVMNVCANFKSGWFGNVGGDATYCALTANQAVFHTFRGNPIERWYADAEAWDKNQVSVSYDTNPILGIRYYILGIPA